MLRKLMTAASMREQLFIMGAARAKQQLETLQEKLLRRFEAPTSPAQMPPNKKEEESWKRSTGKEKPVVGTKLVHQRQVSAVKALQPVLFLILLGSRVQMVKAVELEISVRHWKWISFPLRP